MPRFLEGDQGHWVVPGLVGAVAKWAGSVARGGWGVVPGHITSPDFRGWSVNSWGALSISGFKSRAKIGD